jgi:streptogramin lyase
MEGRLLLATIMQIGALAPPAQPAGIVAGPDGNLWFTELVGNKIGRITPSGQITEFSTGLSPGASPADITAGPDGALWFTELNGDRIGRITTSGTITEFSTGLSAGAEPLGIAAGPDGNLWFTEFSAAKIGQITPSGVIQEFSTGLTPGSQPAEIAAGPDGALWFAEFGAAQIGRITTSGVITEFSTGITPGAGPAGIVTGPDGALWFTEHNVGQIGRITTAGSVTEFSAGLNPMGGMGGIVVGPDGALWFTEFDGNQIGRITTSGQATQLSAGIPPNAHPTDIALGPDGNLYFTEFDANGIAQVLFPSQTVISVTGDTIQANAGPLTATFATFTTTTPGAKASDFHATVSFGDDTSGPGTIVADPSVAGRFDVRATHTYQSAGNYPTLIVVTDQERNTGQGAGEVIVPATVSVTGTTVTPTAGQSFTGVFATFTTTAAGAKASDFTAVVGFGDNTTGLGGIIADPFVAGRFDVVATHTYRLAQTFQTVITVTNLEGHADTALGQAIVTQPGVDGPIVTSFQRFGIHRQPTRLVLTFNEALDPARAENPANYVLVAPGPNGEFTGPHAHVIPISHIIYDPVNLTVTLIPDHRLSIYHRYQLTVIGMPPSGLTDTDGRFLDGAKTGQPGSNFVAIVDKAILVLDPVRHGKKG